MVFDLLLIGLAITLEPIPLTAFTLILGSTRGTRKAAAFIVGWFASLAVVVAGTLAVTGNQPPKPNTAPSLAALATKLAIGVVLVLFAARKWRRLDTPKKPKDPPRWQQGINDMSMLFAFGLGPLTQPWGLVAAGVAIVVGAKLSSWQSYVVIAAFCVVATGVYLAMEIYAIARPDETKRFLDGLRRWIQTHTDQVIIVISLIVGLWLTGTSIYSLVT